MQDEYARLYIWSRISDLTYNCHSSGGLVVVASSLDDARDRMRRRTAELLAEEKEDNPDCPNLWVGFPEECEAYTRDPDAVFRVVRPTIPYDDLIWVFKDAGCC